MARRHSRSLYRSIPRWFAAALLFTSALAASQAILATPAAAVVDVRGFVSAGGSQAEAPTSWRTGEGFGLFDLGADAEGRRAEDGRADLHLVVDASTDVGRRTTLGAFLHLTARAESDDVVGEEAENVGVIEAYLEGRWRLRDADLLRLQLGHFLLPTSRENTSWAWSSPYTLTFSAINSWIAEEVRPTGLLLEYRAALGQVDQLRLGASAFGGNDTAGTLLAWRGWSLHDRLTVWDEVAPLPPTPSLAPGGAFGLQRGDGTLPMGEDLDERVGYAGWLAWHHGETSMVQASYYDNRGDRGLWHSGGPGGAYEYAWDTWFWHVAWEAQLGRLTLASEWMDGETGMGFAPFPHVDVGFEAAYVLASVLTDPWLGGTWRFTARVDDFETVDLDRVSPVFGDDNDGDGSAVTAAVFWEWLRRPLRVGVEYLDADATRDQAGAAGFGSQVGGEQIRLELRYFFGR